MSDERLLSEKIEGTIEGVLSFVYRYFRTTWTIFWHPLSWPRKIAPANPKDRLYVLPFTYLAFGGFFFTLTISSYPRGLVGLLDLIWFDDEISQAFYERFDEIFTITALLTSAFPVFLSVTICSSAAGLFLGSATKAKKFLAINCYAFGYQCAMIFLPMLSIIFGDFIVSGLEVPVPAFIRPALSHDMLYQVIWVVIGVVMASAFLAPLVSLSSWAWSAFRSKTVFGRAYRQALAALYALFLFVVITYAASVPGALSSHFNVTPPTLVLDSVGDVSMRIARNASGGYTGIARFIATVENKSGNMLIKEKRYLSLRLIREEAGKPDEIWAASNPDMSAPEFDGDFLTIPPHLAAVLTIEGAIDIPEPIFRQMKDKSEGTPQSNEYGFFLGVTLFHDHEELDRRISIDPTFDDSIAP